MGFNFPNSPTQGQEFITPTGMVYKFVSPTWTLQGAGATGPTGPQGPAGPVGAVSVTISDTFPAGPVSGQMWWNSANGNLYLYYNDGSSSQWVQINSVGS